MQIDETTMDKPSLAMKETSPMNAMEVDSIQTCPSLAEEFLTILKEKVQFLDIESILEEPSKAPLEVIDNVLQNLELAVEESNDEHFAGCEEDLIGFTEQVGMVWSHRMIRSQLFRYLLPYYHLLIDHLQFVLLQIFQMQAKKVSPYVFHQLQQQIVDEFQLRAKILRKGFDSMINGKRSNGILSTSYLPEKNTEIKDYSFPSADFKLSSLREQLKQLRSESLSAVIIQGKHNPYIRTAPFPPCHINFNYQLDPSSIQKLFVWNRTGRELKQIYDVQKPGFARGRAEPMKFPGVADFPFDPAFTPPSLSRAAESKNYTWFDRLRDIVNREIIP